MQDLCVMKEDIAGRLNSQSNRSIQLISPIGRACVYRTLDLSALFSYALAFVHPIDSGWLRICFIPGNGWKGMSNGNTGRAVLINGINNRILRLFPAEISAQTRFAKWPPPFPFPSSRVLLCFLCFITFSLSLSRSFLFFISSSIRLSLFRGSAFSALSVVALNSREKPFDGFTRR
jgi:hypothetical protein